MIPVSWVQQWVSLAGCWASMKTQGCCTLLIQHVCGSVPTPDSLGTASANGLYTREIWIYDKRESSSKPEGRAWNLLCVNIQHWPLCTAESVYSNNSRSGRNISHPCFYSSPASLCTCFLSNRELVPKFSIHLCGVTSTLATLCCIQGTICESPECWMSPQVQVGKGGRLQFAF